MRELLLTLLLAVVLAGCLGSSGGTDTTTPSAACDLVRDRIVDADTTASWAGYFNATPTSVSCICSEKGDTHDLVVIWEATAGSTYRGSASLNSDGSSWSMVGNPTVWTWNGTVLDDRDLVIDPFRESLSACADALPDS